MTRYRHHGAEDGPACDGPWHAQRMSDDRRRGFGLTRPQSEIIEAIV